jgi:hypothetical protein
MIHLPHSSSTPTLISFGVLATLVGQGLLMMAWYCDLVRGSVLLIAQAGLAAGGIALILNPDQLERPYATYRWWAELLGARCLRRWILILLFVLVIPVARLGGSTHPFGKSPGGDSSWESKEVRQLLGGGEGRQVVVDERARRSWMAGLWAWAKEGENLWLVALAPFLWVLALTVSPEDRRSASSETYTLY